MLYYTGWPTDNNLNVKNSQDSKFQTKKFLRESIMDSLTYECYISDIKLGLNMHSSHQFFHNNSRERIFVKKNYSKIKKNIGEIKISMKIINK